MRRFMYAIVSTLLVTSIIPSASAKLPPSSAEADSIIHSAAYPNRVKVTSATYHVGLKVGSSGLSEIRFNIPENAPAKIQFGRVKVADARGQLIATESSGDGNNLMIRFTQPVAVGTTLEIDLEGVRTSDLLGRTWLFPMYGRRGGATQDFPLGTARIQTYQ